MMVSFQQQGTIVSEVMQLRERGLSDALIMEELAKRGYRPDQISAGISQLDQSAPSSEEMPSRSFPEAPSYSTMPAAGSASPDSAALYDRMAEVAENIIDEKWDQLIAEVKKIVDWKEKMEEKQRQMVNDVQKLKEDFKVLHQGVLGKIDDYDARMRDVGTELNAVGKVFKDVIPEFVENVKELSFLTGRMKEKKK